MTRRPTAATRSACFSYSATALGLLSLGAIASCQARPVGQTGLGPVASAPIAAPASSPVSSSASSSAPSPAPAARQNYFREAVNRASSAVVLGQSAQSPDDWQLAASRWQQALSLMQKVPAGDPNHATAQIKIKEYRQHLARAQQRVRPTPAAPAQAVPAAAESGLVAQIPIVERRGGTPIVSVTLQGQNGRQQFPMLFDTGATGTLITAEMAAALGVTVVGETVATIADGSQVTLPIGYVDVLEVGGLRKEGVTVAIGGSVGLLGQDIYGDYGISLGGDSISLYE